MMKQIIIILIAFTVVGARAQKKKKREQLQTYTDAQGYVYNLGEDIILNAGSRDDGTFNFIKQMVLGGNVKNAEPHFANRKFKIGIIKKLDTRTRKMVEMTALSGAVFLIIDIENAARVGEIGNGKVNVASASVNESDKYDKLAKLKKLFDDGVLSKDEYESEKKKLLSQ